MLGMFKFEISQFSLLFTYFLCIKELNRWEHCSNQFSFPILQDMFLVKDFKKYTSEKDDTNAALE